ncbi:hypothetical protein N9N17_00445 [Schleiferiaceae bacterium]|nr:hypothetical protein [Schleiferiaceae bacterium]
MMLRIPTYKGDLDLIKALEQLVRTGFSELFEAVLAHGSVGTNEVIKYSDFDGLLIVKDEYFGTKKLAEFQKRSMDLINQFDPLQHHGWFMLKASHLEHLNPTYLPPEVLENASVIWPPQDLEFEIQIQSDVDWKKPAATILQSLDRKLENYQAPIGMFNLKSWLSEIMLVPTLIYQAKHKEGIFKRESFAAVEDLYTKEAWRVINTATEIRAEWEYKLRFPKLFTSLKNRKGLKKMVRRHLAPSIPEELSTKMPTSFEDDLKRFVEESKKLLAA